jgi:hypothetical protein
MLKAFVDDSSMNQPPVYVLGGWVGPASAWATFSDAWQDVLWMKPRIRYFKYAEAIGCGGEFHGISEQSRNEKLRLLVGLLDEFKLLGLASIIPATVFSEFQAWLEDNSALRNPYILAFYSLIARLAQYQDKNGKTEKVEFVFDNQDDQIEKVLGGWNYFKKSAPSEYKQILGNPPTFQDDKETIALQAADLHAGWLRQMHSANILGLPKPAPLWGEKGNSLRRIESLLSKERAQYIYTQLHKFRGIGDPVKLTATYGYGLRE